MKTLEEIREMHGKLAEIRNGMNLDDNAISEMISVEHEIYALAWVLEMIPDLPFAIESDIKRSEKDA